MTHLIVGALSARGAALAHALARERRDLVLADSAGPALDALVRELTSYGGPVRGVTFSYDTGWAERLIAEVVSLQSVTFGLPDVRPAALDALDLAAWDRGFDEATRRPWQLAKAAAGALRRSSGRYLLLGDRAALARPALAGTAFLIQSIPEDVGFGASVVVGDDPAQTAVLGCAIVALAAPLLHGHVLTAGSAASPAPGEPGTAQRDTRWPSRLLITGGAGEIARSLCEALAVHGPLAAMLVDTDAPRLAATAAALASQGMRIETIIGDLADPDLPARAVAIALERFGGVDAVFSHAGVGLGAAVLDMTEADFDRTFTVNLRASWLLAEASKPALAKSGGSFVATSSVGAVRPGMAAPVYSASKAALLRLVERLAVEWGPLGIRVNALSPGSTLTPMNRLWQASDAERAQAVAGYPLRRMAAPGEVGAAMAFLASPQASYVSGHNLVVDGGLSRLFL